MYMSKCYFIISKKDNIGPPSCCNSKSCVNVTSPSDPIAIASVSDAEPMLPASGMIRLPLKVVTCDIK